MKKEALNFLENHKEVATKSHYVRHGRGIDDMLIREEYHVDSVSIDDAKEAVEIAVKGMINGPKWRKITKNHSLPKFEEVLAYNKEWVEADWNPTGIRIGYLGEDGFVSAKYDPDSEGYGACFEEGDDYDVFWYDENGKQHTTYNNGDGRGDMEGHRPNMPTHYMLIPKFK